MSALQYSTFETDEASYVTFVGPDKPWVAASTHPNYDKIVSLLERSKSGEDIDAFKVVDLFDIEALLARTFKRLSDRIMVRGGEIYVDGEAESDVIGDQILAYLEDGNEDYEPLVKFYELLLTNPNKDSRTRLYAWMEKEALSITEDGYIIAYKGVNLDTDDEGNACYVSSNKGPAIVDGVEDDDGGTPVRQYAGSFVQMPRGQVTHDPHQDCAFGLHVGTWGYASTFAKLTLEVHVNPRDVVSVPQHDANKMRVCAYRIVGEVTSKYDTPVVYHLPEEEVDEFVADEGAPTKAEFADMRDRAKRRKQNFRKYAEKQGPWIFKGDAAGDVFNRLDWVVE